MCLAAIILTLTLLGVTSYWLLHISTYSGTKINLPEEVERLVLLGYPNELGMSLQDYLNSIPTKPIKLLFTKRKYSLVLVDPRLPLQRQIELAGIIAPKDLSGHENLFVTPGKPYWIRLCKGESNLNALEFSGFLHERERGLNTLEGVSLIMQNPSTIQDRWLGLSGSRFRDEGICCLGHLKAPAPQSVHLFSYPSDSFNENLHFLVATSA